MQVHNFYNPNQARKLLEAAKSSREILGHSEISMILNAYSHVLPTMQLDAMNRLNEIFDVQEDEEVDDEDEESE